MSFKEKTTKTFVWGGVGFVIQREGYNERETLELCPELRVVYEGGVVVDWELKNVPQTGVSPEVLKEVTKVHIEALQTMNVVFS